MTWFTQTEEDDGGVKHVYAFEDDHPGDRTLVYSIDASNKVVRFFPKDEFVVDELTLEGFSQIPDEFADAGYIPGAQYYLNKKLGQFSIQDLVISKSREDRIRKVRGQDAYRVVMNYGTFQRFKQGLTDISQEAKQERSSFADDFFREVFPSRFESAGTSDRRRARRVIRNLDDAIVEQFSTEDVEKFLDFFEVLLSTKYKNAARRREFFGAAKIKVDEVTLSEVITRFEKLFEEDPPESRWAEFLRMNLFLIESKYIRVIPELNVVLGSQRKVDFGLVDAQGYLDLFEIKKPTTKLLAAQPDRGNYYWHSDSVKAITQAEKYLFNAERKAPALVEDITRQRNVDVRVVRPRAVIIMGSRNQLTDQAMEEDFRVLRQSLKNVEIVLYDELLERLRNQRTKLYVGSDLTLTSAVEKIV